MLLSRAFWQTYKEVPADAEIPSHQLMIRAGLIHKSGSGLYNYLPMGLRAIQKFESIVRQELNSIGAEEVTMTVVTPGELWQETGRWDKMGGQMLRFKDKKDADLCISPTNEEAVTDIFRKTIKSYKQLPVSLYQINTKFRDEIRPRFGLMRGREFTMKDAYSFHLDKESMDASYTDFYRAYTQIFTRVGLEFIAVEADGGAMADSDAKTHEFQVIADAGEDLIVYSAEAGYAANIEKAKTIRTTLNFIKNNEAASLVETPNQKSIEEISSFLKVEACQTLKTLLYSDLKSANPSYFLVVLLGDDEVNEVKLYAALKREMLVLANDGEIERLGLSKGFLGPVNLPSASNIQMIIDTAVDTEASFVVGANKKDFHLKNVQVKRDVKIGYSAHDLRMAKSGDLTMDGASSVVYKRGIEVGHIFQLGDKYTKGMAVTVLDQNGKQRTPLMGCYGIGITRVVAAAIEQCHDKDGIIWPKSIAPFHIYLASIVKSEEFEKIAMDLYLSLKKANFEVLYDDRPLGPGNKFKDADLLGLPIRVVFGERDFKEKGVVEVIERKSKNTYSVTLEQLPNLLNEILARLS